MKNSLKILVLCTLTAFSFSKLALAFNPSQQTLEISKKLRPISNQNWEQIAGQQLSQAYGVTQGDTLWGISKRLFGDGYYWPKVWAINNQRITNPHLIQPGYEVFFQPGTGTSLPSVGIRKSKKSIGLEVLASEDSPIVKKNGQWKRRSDEWKYLPRQAWETTSSQLPGQVDPNGFDRRSKLNFHKPSGLALPSFIETMPLEPVGTIVGAQSQASSSISTEEVYIDSEFDVQPGEVFSVVDEPKKVSGEISDSAGLVYTHLGTIKIEKIADDVIIARVLNANDPIPRNSIIVPEIEKIRSIELADGPEEMDAYLILDPNEATFTTAQFKISYVDRGSEDGVEEGMVFRAYRHKDKSTDQTITEGDSLPEADFIVLDASEAYSTVLAIGSTDPISKGRRVTLLTDTADVSMVGIPGVSTADQEEESDDLEEDLDDEEIEEEEDSLDDLDDGGALSDAEKRELKQLEDWDGNPPEDFEEDEEEDSEEEEFEDEFYEEGEDSEEDDEEYDEEFDEEEYDDGGEGEEPESEEDFEEDDYEEEEDLDEDADEDEDDFFDEDDTSIQEDIPDVDDPTTDLPEDLDNETFFESSTAPLPQLE